MKKYFGNLNGKVPDVYISKEVLRNKLRKLKSCGSNTWEVLQYIHECGSMCAFHINKVFNDPLQHGLDTTNYY